MVTPAFAAAMAGGMMLPPRSKMNTSMTINATAPWLLALYIAAAEEQGSKPTS